VIHPAWGSSLEPIALALAARTSIASIREPAFKVVHALQRERPSVQIEAAFLAAAIMAQAAGLDPHELIERANRQIPDADAAYTTHAGAIREYTRGELI